MWGRKGNLRCYKRERSNAEVAADTFAKKRNTECARTVENSGKRLQDREERK